MSALGTYLRSLREERAESLKHAAPRLGVSYTYLSKVENGLQTPSSDLLERLALYYNVDSAVLDVLVGRIPDDVLAALQNDPEAAVELLRKQFG